MNFMVCVPGWQDSGPDHWQTLWCKGYPNTVRVAQRDWLHPNCLEWVAGLAAAIAEQDEPVVLVAHSLGCSTVVHWAAQASLLEQRRIKGALLVAPPDVRGTAFRAQVPARGFDAEPNWQLPFPSIVVASSDDPFCAPMRAVGLARGWGSRLVTLAHAGHINAESRLGHWEAGQKLLQRLLLA